VLPELESASYEAKILIETDQNDVVQVIYTQGPGLYGNLISQVRGSASRFYAFDGLGSTDRLTDGTGIVTDSNIYGAFGNIQAGSGTTVNPIRFVGGMGYYFDPDLAQYGGVGSVGPARVDTGQL
jgi:hypothetical protein